MKNKLVIVIGIIVLVILGMGLYKFYNKSSQSDSMMVSDEVMMPKDQATAEPSDNMMKEDNTVMEKEEVMEAK